MPTYTSPCDVQTICACNTTRVEDMILRIDLGNRSRLKQASVSLILGIYRLIFSRRRDESRLREIRRTQCKMKSTINNPHFATTNTPRVQRGNGKNCRFGKKTTAVAHFFCRTSQNTGIPHIRIFSASWTFFATKAHLSFPSNE